MAAPTDTAGTGATAGTGTGDTTAAGTATDDTAVAAGTAKGDCVEVRHSGACPAAAPSCLQ